LIPEAYREAGRITNEVKEVVRSKVAPGIGYVEICELVEREIASRGGAPAFPVGIGANHVTAHYSPQEDDRSTYGDRDLLKVDFGVHVDGYVVDTAVSLTSNLEYELLLDATKSTLEAAVGAVRKDVRTGEIGGVVRREATRFGFKTIENLTGHTVERYIVHAGKSIPNIPVPGLQSLRTGDVFAIEPFLTLGSAAGYVVDAPQKTIFSIVARRRTGDRELDAFAEKVWEDRKTLPFTPRWYAAEFGSVKARGMVERLVSKKVARAYPTLVEASRSPVCQFEHTMALDDGGLVILT